MEINDTIIKRIHSYVLEHKKDITSDLQNWIKVNAVFDASTVGKNQPFGRNVYRSMNYMVQLAQRDNFLFKEHEGYALSIKQGKKGRLFAAVGHCDTVPFQADEWKHGPLSGYIDKDNNIHGRGTQDDKGPVMASFWAMKLIRDLKLDTMNNKRFHLIIGGDEERGCQGIQHYLKNYEIPEYSYTPDGMFPVVFSENAIAVYEFSTALTKHGQILDFRGGQAANIVPGRCCVTVTKISDLENKFAQFLKDEKIKGTITLKKGTNDVYDLCFFGKAAHACEPHLGRNAITLAAVFLMNCCSQLPNYIKFISKCLHNSFNGENLDIYFVDEVTGKTLVNLAIVETNNDIVNFVFNIRWPICVTDEVIEAGFFKNLKKYFVSYKTESIKRLPALYVKPSHGLVQTLDLSYRLITGDNDTPLIATAGGTYARSIPNCVAFGMLFPKTADYMHQANERVPINDLLQAVEIYAIANLRLMKDK